MCFAIVLRTVTWLTLREGGRDADAAEVQASCQMQLCGEVAWLDLLKSGEPAKG